MDGYKYYLVVALAQLMIIYWLWVMTSHLTYGTKHPWQPWRDDFAPCYDCDNEPVPSVAVNPFLYPASATPCLQRIRKAPFDSPNLPDHVILTN